MEVKRTARIFLEGKFRTTALHVHDMLHDFLLFYPLKGTGIPDLEIGELKHGNHEVSYQLGLGRYKASENIFFDAVGMIEVQPVSDIEAWVKITGDGGGGLRTIAEDKEIFPAGNKFLEKFTIRFIGRMGDGTSEGDEQTEKAQIVVQAPPPNLQEMEDVKKYSLDGKHTIQQIALKVGVSISTVKRYRKKWGIKRKL